MAEKRRKLDLSPYKFKTGEDEHGNDVEVEVEVRKAVAGFVLFQEGQNNHAIKGRELLKFDQLFDDIEACEDDEFLVPKDMWGRFVEAAERRTGLGRMHVELLRRIFDAPEVDVDVTEKDGDEGSS